MNGVISKIIKIQVEKMPPTVEFIENEIIANNIEPLRWAIVEINGTELTISVSGRELIENC